MAPTTTGETASQKWLARLGEARLLPIFFMRMSFHNSFYQANRRMGA
jgi:hypothetical protein